MTINYEMHLLYTLYCFVFEINFFLSYLIKGKVVVENLECLLKIIDFCSGFIFEGIRPTRNIVKIKLQPNISIIYVKQT